jgi:hypothetical protein
MAILSAPITVLQGCDIQTFTISLSNIYGNTQTIYNLAKNGLDCQSNIVNLVTWEIKFLFTDYFGNQITLSYGPSNEYNPNYGPVFPESDLMTFLTNAFTYWQDDFQKYGMEVLYSETNLNVVVTIKGCNYLQVGPQIKLNPTLTYICN